MCGEAKAKAAAALLIDELSTDPARKVVVFAHHASVLDTVLAALRADEIGAVEITGRIGPADRQRAVDAFQRDASVRVACCNIVAGGVGITLTAAHDVVMIEQSYVPGENLQAADRCHRIGQRESVLVRVLVLSGSVDSHVAEALALKRAMLAATVQPTEGYRERKNI